MALRCAVFGPHAASASFHIFVYPNFPVVTIARSVACSTTGTPAAERKHTKEQQLGRHDSLQTSPLCHAQSDSDVPSRRYWIINFDNCERNAVALGLRCVPTVNLCTSKTQLKEVPITYEQLFGAYPVSVRMLISRTWSFP